MRKQYDDFTQLKLKDMSKTMSDMTYKYVNPDTKEPTRVPAAHYEKILDQIKEQYLSEITSKQFLTIMFNQLKALKQEDEKYFQQALICLDLNLKPNDLRIDEQIALAMTYDDMEKRQELTKRDFHFLNDTIIETFKETKNNPEIQAQIIQESNEYEAREQEEMEMDY